RIELLQLDYFGLEGAEPLSVGADIFSGPILTRLRDSCSPMAEERGPPSQPSPLSPSSAAAARQRAQYGTTASSSGRRVGRSTSRYSVRTVNPVLRRSSGGGPHADCSSRGTVRRFAPVIGGLHPRRRGGRVAGDR